MKTVREFMNARRRKTGERRIQHWIESRRFCELQGDQSIANQAGAAFRSDLNNELQALVTLSSGTAAPGTTYAHQLWADTTNNVLKKRNAANSAWLVVRTLDESFVLSRGSNTILGLSDIGKTIVATAAFTQTLTAAATLGDGWWVAYASQGNAIVFDPNASETIDGATTKTVTGSGFIFCNGSAFFTVSFGSISLGTPAATTSGTAIDYTNIPAGTKRISVSLHGVSTNGTNQYLIQIGPSGGVETSGYNALANASAFSIGVGIPSGAAANVWYGQIVFVLENSTTNTWSYFGIVFTGTTSVTISGTKPLAGVLNKLRLTTAGGVDTFDLGEMNIACES